MDDGGLVGSFEGGYQVLGDVVAGQVLAAGVFLPGCLVLEQGLAGHDLLAHGGSDLDGLLGTRDILERSTTFAFLGKFP